MFMVYTILKVLLVEMYVDAAFVKSAVSSRGEVLFSTQTICLVG